MIKTYDDAAANLTTASTHGVRKLQTSRFKDEASYKLDVP